MKQANLISILSAFKTLDPSIFGEYLKYHSIIIKLAEIADLEVLVDELKTLSKNIKTFDNFFIGYIIPQIGKEFDLLRIGEESVINIELKKSSTFEDIKRQLLRNKYYLSFLKKDVFNFTYISDERKLYQLDDEKNLVEVNIKVLISLLASQNAEKIIDINSYFIPSNYLVSPFNSTKEFAQGKYFLTSHQEEIKNIILKEMETPTYSIISIKGKAGTGKTLLTYDIAKVIHEQKNILIVHCGYLNAGHIALRDDYGWNIVSIKDALHHDFSKFALIVIDEAQRIYISQLPIVISRIKELSINCIFSYDGLQTLSNGEIKNNIESLIEKEVTIKAFELTTKIRTNKEVALFIRCLFNKSKSIEKLKYSNININYCNDYVTAKKHLDQMKLEGCKIINYTPTRTTLTYDHYKIDDENDNAHTVIGQEYDNVAAVIDAHYYYKGDELSTTNHRFEPHYNITKMLFQIVSRTRSKLSIVIINNPEILTRCLDILKN